MIVKNLIMPNEMNYLDAKRKRHVVGGVLISVSFLFGGLALTVFTIKEDERSSYEQSTN